MPRKSRLLRCLAPLLYALAAVVIVPSAHATWYQENVEDGADIMMMDLRWPWWPSGSYFANWNSGFNPKPNNLSFYAGFVSDVPDGPGSLPNPDAGLQSSFRPGSVWTFWGAGRDGTPVRFTDVAPNLFIKNDYGGEGSSGTLGGEPWRFVEVRRWYTMLARVWRQPDGSEPGSARVGRWIKDVSNGRWHLVGQARLPIAATSFTGNSGFLEPLGSEKAVRSLHRRLGYFRKDGAWRKSDAISIDKTEFVVVGVLPEDDHEYVAIEYAQRPDLLPRELSGKPLAGDRKHRFTVRQSDLPALDAPAVSDVRAVFAPGQLLVTWSVPDSAAPQLGFRVEVFDSPACEGTPRSILDRREPTARHALVDLPEALATPGVRLTVTDVFDQSTPPTVVRAEPTPRPSSPQAVPGSAEGLRYTLFWKESRRRVSHFHPPAQRPNEEHHWLHLDEIRDGRRLREGRSRGFDIGLREEIDSGYALVFRGLLRVSHDGFHAIHAHVDGAFRILVDGTELLSRDGQWGTVPVVGTRHLAAGDHALEVVHLYDELPARNFRLDWEGPGMPLQPIPLEALRTKVADDEPTAVLRATAPGDGTGRIEVVVEARGHQVDRTVLRLGALELARVDGPHLVYEGPLPKGPQTFRSRVFHDGDRTVDSDPVTLTVSGPAADPGWTVRNVGDDHASAGLWQTGPGAFQFFGDGMHVVTRRVEGDFTATCRVDAFHGSAGEPVNRQAWVGLTAREHAERRNWEWGRDFHLVQTAAEGLRASADFTDFGATRVSSYRLPDGHPWLRIVRRGSIWTAWSSADGKSWELGAYQFRKMAPALDVGLFFSALPQDAKAHYRARVSSLEIQPGAPPEAAVPEPPVARGTDGDRITGVVTARSDPKVAVVRSTSLGLLRTEDGGATWNQADGGLDGEALAVRSVAIHPADPRILVRACGRGAGGTLWRSGDAGRSWTRFAADRELDFDAVGPSALCGEVVAFDLRRPDTLYVGTESKGLLKSVDGGTTWTNLGLVGERITAVAVWPWEEHYPAPAQGKSHLCVTTCADRWMPLLGRGVPAVRNTGTVSRGYVSRDDVRTLVVADERDDTGFYNVAFDKALQSVGEMRYGTSHGMQSQVFEGWHMALYPPAKSLEWKRPMTAVGAAAVGDRKFGRFLAQVLDPADPGRISSSERWAFEWSWLRPQGDSPAGGMIAVAGDVRLGRRWWFVHTDGLWTSEDGGLSRRRLLDRRGDRTTE